MTQNRLSKVKKEELYHSVIPIAKKFRSDFLNIEEPIEDTFKTLERLGFFILRFPTHEKLSGFNIKKGDHECIFINSAHSLGRQYFSAWHEVYHAYTGDRGGISLTEEVQYNERECKADAFASCILMPEKLIRRYIRDNRVGNLQYISHIHLIQMQNFFHVSYSALIQRLTKIYPEYNEVWSNRRHLGSLTNAEKMVKKIELAGGDISLAKPTNDFTVSSRFHEMIHSNLEKDRISVDKAQSLLDLLERIKKQYEN